MHVRRRLRATHAQTRRAQAEAAADFAAPSCVPGRNRELLANADRESPSSHGLSSPRAGACRDVCPRACGLCMCVSRMRAPDVLCLPLQIPSLVRCCAMGASSARLRLTIWASTWMWWRPSGSTLVSGGRWMRSGPASTTSSPFRRSRSVAHPPAPSGVLRHAALLLRASSHRVLSSEVRGMGSAD